MSARTQIIRVAATFVADAVLDTLRMWAEMLALPVAFEMAPFDQVDQELRRLPETAGAGDLFMALVRPEDWIRVDEARLPDPSREAHEMRERVGDCLDVAGRVSAAVGVDILFVFCPDSPRADTPEWRAARAALLAELDARGRRPGTLHVLTDRDILSAYPVADVHDPVGDATYHAPFTERFYVALGTALARRLYARLGAPHKVIALDCDNTLWAGVCGEGEPGSVVVDEHAAVLQTRMRTLRDTGRLLCLCSKNNEDDVREAFRRTPGMVLEWSDFAARRINWERKSANLASLAAELGVSASAIVHIDDDPLECAEIAAFAPDVLPIQLPADRRRTSEMLDHVWAFDVTAGSTTEDRHRHRFYQDAERRDALRASVQSVEAFIASLEVRVDVQPAAAADWPRVLQLLRRTNQFNSAGGRLSESDARRLCLEDGELLVVRVRDRFGDYGLVGVAQFHCTHAVVVRALALSCRALGRGVEHEMMRAIARRACAAGIATVELKCRRTPWNAPVQTFFHTLPGVVVADRDGESTFTVSAMDLVEDRVACAPTT